MTTDQVTAEKADRARFQTVLIYVILVYDYMGKKNVGIIVSSEVIKGKCAITLV